MANLDRIDETAFGEAVESRKGLTIVEFGAPWCPPCRVLMPVLEQLAVEYEERVRFVEVDTDVSPALGARFGIRGLPTLVFFRDGDEFDRVVGLTSKAQLRERIESHLVGAGALP